MKLDSFCVKGSEDKVTTKPHVLPIYATSSFVFEDTQQGIRIFSGEEEGHKYSRYGNPTIDAVSDKLAQMAAYGTEAKVKAYMTSSGMSAIHIALTSLVQAGDAILTQGSLYGGTTELLNTVLSKSNVSSIFTDLRDLSKVEETLANNSNIKVCYFETPSNPALTVLDIEALCAICKSKGVITIADNTFCTPYLQRPIALGTDIVIHSTTKYLSGHGNSIAGAIICQEKFAYQIWNTLKLTGSTCNAWDAWLTDQGMKTLALRMDRHSSNALHLAQFLEAHPQIQKVNYPGLSSHPEHKIAAAQMSNFGGMMSFELKGDLQRGIAFMDKLKICTQAPTLGDVDTLVLHPASSSHLRVSQDMREKNGISDTLIRMSIGIESFEDIKQDIEQALS